MKERARNLIRGALVADAAAMGLHWMYDVDRLAEVGGDAPEFFEPDVAHYRGTKGYFAHRGKSVGDLSHYGEQLRVMLASLEATDGVLDIADYERRFCDTFGPGGSWVGYIDYPTRVTLRNVDAAEVASIAAADAFDMGAHEPDRGLMKAKVMANVQKWRGDQLARAMEKAVRITHPDDDELVAVGQAMARAVEAARGGVHGADDVQLPAVSKLPALLAYGVTDIEPAVRVTNDNDDAVAWARRVAEVLQAVLDGATPNEACASHEGEIGDYGIACPLADAVPLSFALLRDATDFRTTVRRNILVGGDNCGRAIIVGAALGAAYGVPDDWLVRARTAEDVS